MKQALALIVLMVSVLGGCVSTQEQGNLRAASAEIPLEPQFFDELNDPQVYEYLELEPESAKDGCLTRTESRLLATLMTIILNDGVSVSDLFIPWRFATKFKRELGSVRVVNDSCYKKLTNSRGQSLILFRYERDGKSYLRARFNAHEAASADPSCLNDALAVTQRLPPFATNIVAAHRERHKAEWKDPELSPRFYLDCDSGRGLAFDESVAVMLHELNHETNSDSCIFVSFTNEYLCFSEIEKAPARDIAKVRTSFRNTLIDNALDRFQATYLMGYGASFMRLFDELNSYTVTAHVSVARMRQHSNSKSYLNGLPTDEYLPIIGLLCANYLATLHAKYGDTYARLYGEGTQNRTHFDVLFSNAREAYEEWKRERARLGLKPSDLDPVWQRFLSTYKSLP